MPSDLHQRPTSFRARFAGGTLRFGDVAGIVLAGTAVCAAGLFGVAALLVAPPAGAGVPAHASAMEASPARDLGTYVGHWVSDKGAHLIVARSGAVWSDGGGLIGSARLDGRDPTRLVFEGATFRCSYTVAAEQPDALVWRVIDGTPGTACPQGRYNRRYTF